MIRKVKFLLEYVFSLIFFALPAFIFAMPCKLFVHDLWLVSECGKFARDNGFCLYKYIRESYPRQKIIFVINKKSIDYNKVKMLGKSCSPKSFMHWFYYILCSKEITSNPHVKPTHYISKFLWTNKTYFIQHGIIRDFLPCYSSKKFNFKLFTATVNEEYEYILKYFGFTDKVVKKLGMARYDNLLELGEIKNQILIMPTWREYLRNISEQEFIKSEYFQIWNSLINNKRLISLAENHKFKIVFYLHRELQKFMYLFNADSTNIIVANANEYSIPQLLKESKLLITDYSSVFFDFLYMYKPVIWYVFDKQTYYAKHHEKGYFNEANNDMGVAVYNENECLNAIKEQFISDFKISKTQELSISKFFVYRDNHNCSRIYNFIKGEK